VKPALTVVMPVYNEALFIENTLNQLLDQDCPSDFFEVIVADGGSTDNTREVVANIANSHPNIHLFDNPKKRSSSARNIGFMHGQGDYFLVIDGHCYIPSRTLLTDAVNFFREQKVHCLGRPQPLDPPDISTFQQLVALARSSSLGHGPGSLIFSDYEGEASPVSNGAAYSREVFSKVGYVDEEFDACEDVEFNLRVEKAGLKAYTSPKLTVRYYPRESIKGLYCQMWRYGFGRLRLLKKHPDTLSAALLVPPSFVVLCCMAVVAFLALWAGMSGPLVWAPLGLMGLYFGLVTIESFRLSEKSWPDVPLLAVMIFFIHIGLGTGFLSGIWDFLRKQKV